MLSDFLDEIQREWHLMHGYSGDEEKDDGVRFRSIVAAFVAFMSLDSTTQARLRLILLSKSVEEAKGIARLILQKALPGLKAQPTVG
jgi:hypothetical protein